MIVLCSGVVLKRTTREKQYDMYNLRISDKTYWRKYMFGGSLIKLPNNLHLLYLHLFSLLTRTHRIYFTLNEKLLCTILNVYTMFICFFSRSVY